MGGIRAKQSGQDQKWAIKGDWDLLQNRQYRVFQTNSPPPPLYLDENSAITRGEGWKPNSSPKPKTLAKKDNLSRKIAHNTIQTIEVGRRDIVLFSWLFYLF